MRLLLLLLLLLFIFEIHLDTSSREGTRLFACKVSLCWEKGIFGQEQRAVVAPALSVVTLLGL